MAKSKPKPNPLADLIRSTPSIAPQTQTPAASHVVGDPLNLPAHERSRFNMWFYGPDRDAMRELVSHVVGTGRKVNESAIMRVALRLLKHDDAFLALYDEIVSEDPRRSRHRQ